MKKLTFSVFMLGASFLTAQPFEKLNYQVGITDTTGGLANNANQGYPISAADFNSDGFDDLTFGTGTSRQTLFYQNDGDGTFTKVFPSDTILDNTTNNKIVLWADIDNDGDKDLFLGSSSSYNRLYRNDGGFEFTDITSISGLSLQSTNTWGSTFGDYDNDGYLDLYICNLTFQDYTNYLYRNNGDNTFTNVTELTGTSDSMRASFMAVFWDYNNDYHQDILIVNDHLWFPNTLYRNNGPDQPFTDVSIESGIFEYMNSMNAGIGDYNNDGFDDVYITNTYDEDTLSNHLMRNSGEGVFVNVAHQAGVEYNLFSWGANWFDYDNDLDLDLYVSSKSDQNPSQNSVLFKNQLLELNQEIFTNDWPEGFEGDNPGWCHIVFDYNEDGKPDIVSTYNGRDTISLFRNYTENDNHWIKIALQGVISNRDGIGCRAEAWMNGQKIMRYKHCGEAYISQNSDFLHFGIGNNMVVDSIVIRWLSGVVDVLINPAIDQKHLVVEGTQNSYLNILIQTVSANCEIGNNGTAEVSVIGNYDIDYLWSTGDTTAFIQQLTPGLYYVTVSYEGFSDTASVLVGVIPGGIDIPNNNEDENCDGIILIIDDDNDGYNSDDDCDDLDAAVFPGATEVCNGGIDDDCDELVDDDDDSITGQSIYYNDNDQDGYGAGLVVLSCLQGVLSDNNEDCNDALFAINPAATESCNTGDEDCDGLLEDADNPVIGQSPYFVDNDGDTYGSGTVVLACVQGLLSANDEDCDDTMSSVNPGAIEIPNNNTDEDCDGDIFIIDLDNDDFNSDEDCDDLNPDINPDATEIANNNTDEDCDGVALIIDQDEDGFNSDEDCDDLNAEINPDAFDIPNNNIDEDCDGELAVPVLNVRENELLIYPNPVKDELIVLTNTSRLARVTILDSKGVVVFESDDLLQTEVHIPVQYLPGGMYVVEILLEEGISNYNRTFVKM